jgi:hypothetical protein
MIAGVEALLYATIWAALALFVAAEFGRDARGASSGPARAASLAGAALAIVHTLLVFHLRYHWNHDAAVAATARTGGDVYGVAWRGSLYVNYVFIALWLLAAWRWTHWLWRGFVLLMVVNGAVVFARPVARPFGVVLVALLLWAWLGRRRATGRADPGSVSA